MSKKDKKITFFSEEDIFALLDKRKDLIDAVVVTGGEPTLQKDLVAFIKEIKKRGYLVKLDTNGYQPKILSQIIDQKIVDYLAMDIKGPFYKYSKIVETKIDTDKIKKSIELIIGSGVDHEFRSTILPFWHKKKDIEEMANMIRGTEKYYLQNFIARPDLVNPAFQTAKSYEEKDLKRFAKVAKKIVGHCEVR